MWNDLSVQEHRIDWQSFECRRCGACCKWEGEVRLLPHEPDQIAAYLQLPPTGFIDRYTRLARDRSCLSLIENLEGHCVFYVDGHGCKINPVKPRQCQDFPHFWRCDGWYQNCAGLLHQNTSKSTECGI